MFESAKDVFSGRKRKIADGLDSLRNNKANELPILIAKKDGVAVWEMPLGTHPTPVYMEIKRSPFNNDQRHIFFVDPARFLELWLKQPEAHAVPLQDMPRDPKFQFAKEGFSCGRECPVPFATVGATRDAAGVSMGFDDGITRTFWLLYHHVAALPLHTYHLESAEIIFDAVGGEMPPISV